jgi:nicotinamidase-related amidase
VVHVQNDGSPGEPDQPDTVGWQLFFPVSTGELVVRKNQSDAFAADPVLAKSLADKQVTEVVIAGLQSNYCVADSCRGALNRGLQVILASGAHATYDEDEPAAAISARIDRELAAEGVMVLPSGDISFGGTQ